MCPTCWLLVTQQEVSPLNIKLFEEKPVFVTLGVYNTSISNIEAFFEISEVKELVSYKLGSESLTLGANMTLTNTINLFYEIAKDSKFSYLKKLADHIDLVANVPVRNVSVQSSNV